MITVVNDSLLVERRLVIDDDVDAEVWSAQILWDRRPL